MRGDSQLHDVRDRLRRAFRWRGDRTDENWYADVTGWWRSAGLVSELGPALAGLFRDERPTVVLGVESRGFLLGPLVAQHLRVGFVGVRKNPGQAVDSEVWLRRTTPPDYRDRHLTLGFHKRLVGSADRVLLVDDWIVTGGQATGVRLLTQDAEATWLGVATVVDAITSNEVRRDLTARSLLHIREL